MEVSLKCRQSKQPINKLPSHSGPSVVLNTVSEDLHDPDLNPQMKLILTKYDAPMCSFLFSIKPSFFVNRRDFSVVISFVSSPKHHRTALQHTFLISTICFHSCWCLIWPRCKHTKQLKKIMWDKRAHLCNGHFSYTL